MPKYEKHTQADKMNEIKRCIDDFKNGTRTQKECADAYGIKISTFRYYYNIYKNEDIVFNNEEIIEPKQPPAKPIKVNEDQIKIKEDPEKIKNWVKEINNERNKKIQKNEVPNVEKKKQQKRQVSNVEKKKVNKRGNIVLDYKDFLIQHEPIKI